MSDPGLYQGDVPIANWTDPDRLVPSPVGQVDGRILVTDDDALVYVDAPSGGGGNAGVMGVGPSWDPNADYWVHPHGVSTANNMPTSRRRSGAAVWLPGGLVIGLACHVSTEQASAVGQLALFGCDRWMRLGSLVADGGSTIDLSTPGVKSVAFSGVAINEGWYWPAMQRDSGGTGNVVMRGVLVVNAKQPVHARTVVDLASNTPTGNDATYGSTWPSTWPLAGSGDPGDPVTNAVAIAVRMAAP